MSAAARIGAWDEAVGAALDRVFAPAANPWRHLGSLAFLFFVLCAASGAYLFAVFDTSLAGAHASGVALDRDPLGRLVRGLHRYGADAFALFAALHLVREAARGHFRAHRAWSWITGVALVPLGWVAGITGFWLAWDERALASAVATAEWLAAWPWGLALPTRNFTVPGALNDRFFSLVVFMHIGVPLLAAALAWVHVQRLSHVRMWPPRGLAWPAAASLAVLGLAHPATSLGAADLLAVPSRLAVDWFYFFPHALAARISGEGLWGAVAAVALALVAMPWLGRRERRPAAVVDLGNCNGCARCVADCPFGAVVMVPRTDGRAHPRQAEVIPDLCAACGICAGACPSASPFRRRAPLASGIELPDLEVAVQREALDRVLDGESAPVVTFACEPGGIARGIPIRCAAMLPPAFVQYALRRGAREVVIAACREGDCEHRLGDRWVRERFAGRRAPSLRESVPRERVRVVFWGRDPAPLDRREP